MPLASPNKTVYWECICKLFSVMDHQLSFGVERDAVVEELQYYFEQAQAADLPEDEIGGRSSRDQANWMIRKLEAYGWIDIETDKSYVQRVNFREYAVRILRTLLEVEEGRRVEYQGYIYTQSIRYLDSITVRVLFEIYPYLRKYHVVDIFAFFTCAGTYIPFILQSTVLTNACGFITFFHYCLLKSIPKDEARFYTPSLQDGAVSRFRRNRDLLHKA